MAYQPAHSPLNGGRWPGSGSVLGRTRSVHTAGEPDSEPSALTAVPVARGAPTDVHSAIHYSCSMEDLA